MKTYILVFFFLLLASISDAQNTFVKLYNGVPSGGVSKCLATLPDGGFLIGGQVGVLDSAFYGKAQLRKIDQHGNEVWERRDSIAGFDYINDIVVYDSSTIYCAVSAKANLWVLKRNMEGDILMAKNLFPYSDTCSEPTAMKKTKDGNLIITGAHYDCGIVNFIVLKLDTNADIIWKIQLPVWSYFKNALDVIEAEDSSFVFTGFSNNGGIADPYPGDNAMFGRLSSDGIRFFYKTIPLFNYPSTEGRAIVAMPDNKFLIAGRISTLPLYLPEASFFTTNDTGDVLTSYVDSSGYKGEFFVSAKRHKNYVVLLQHYSHKSGSDSATDFKLIKYDFINDKIIFEQRYLLTGSQEPKDLEILPNGNIAVLFDYLWNDCPQCVGLVVMDSTGYVAEWYPTSLNDITINPDIQVYPNPFERFIRISGLSEADLTMFDYIGREVFSAKSIDANNQIEIPKLPAGLYFLEIKKGALKWTKKLMRL